MAKCDQGYICSACGAEVKRLIDSSLYLQYVIGWIPPEQLHLTGDIHLRCNPVLSQYIRTPQFDPPVIAEGQFAMQNLDPDFVSARVDMITRGYLRLRELQRDRSLPIEQYPLTENPAQTEHPS